MQCCMQLCRLCVCRSYEMPGQVIMHTVTCTNCKADTLEQLFELSFLRGDCSAGQGSTNLTKCAVKDCRLLFQKASTKILLYLMAMGHTVASRSKAPLLNMTQYSLLTQVPSGKMRRGVVSCAATCAFILSPTTLRSFTCTRSQASIMLCQNLQTSTV